MTTTSVGNIISALQEYTSATRLISLTIGASRSPGPELLVEAFCADDALQEVGGCDVIALSTSVAIPLAALLGQAATLDITLADGARSSTSGEISEAAMLGSDGGLTRYRLRIAP